MFFFPPLAACAHTGSFVMRLWHESLHGNYKLPQCLKDSLKMLWDQVQPCPFVVFANDPLSG